MTFHPPFNLYAYLPDLDLSETEAVLDDVVDGIVSTTLEQTNLGGYLRIAFEEPKK